MSTIFSFSVRVYICIYDIISKITPQKLNGPPLKAGVVQAVNHLIYFM